jgi:hypothetical protein
VPQLPSQPRLFGVGQQSMVDQGQSVPVPLELLHHPRQLQRISTRSGAGIHRRDQLVNRRPVSDEGCRQDRRRHQPGAALNHIPRCHTSS